MLLGQKKFTEAEPLLLQGYEGMKQCEKAISPPAKFRLPEAIDRRVRFLRGDRQQGRSVEVAEVSSKCGRRCNPQNTDRVKAATFHSMSKPPRDVRLIIHFRGKLKATAPHPPYLH